MRTKKLLFVNLKDIPAARQTHGTKLTEASKHVKTILRFYGKMRRRHLKLKYCCRQGEKKNQEFQEFVLQKVGVEKKRRYDVAVFVRDEFCGIFERGVKRASGPDALKPSSAFRDRDQWQPGTEFKASMKI